MMNIFRIRTIFSFEHFSSWTLLKFELFSEINFFDFEQKEKKQKRKQNKKNKKTETETENEKKKKVVGV
jgi:hypothetical protein